MQCFCKDLVDNHDNCSETLPVKQHCSVYHGIILLVTLTKRVAFLTTEVLLLTHIDVEVRVLTGDLPGLLTAAPPSSEAAYK